MLSPRQQIEAAKREARTRRASPAAPEPSAGVTGTEVYRPEQGAYRKAEVALRLYEGERVTYVLGRGEVARALRELAGSVEEGKDRIRIDAWITEAKQ